MPSTRTLPEVLGTRPASICSNVDLPQPLGPTSETKLPSGTVNEMSFERNDRRARDTENLAEVLGLDHHWRCRRHRYAIASRQRPMRCSKTRISSLIRIVTAEISTVAAINLSTA